MGKRCFESFEVFSCLLTNINPRILSNFWRPLSKKIGKSPSSRVIHSLGGKYLTIIPRARMGYWLKGHEGERNNCFSKIQLVGQKYRDKPTLAG